MASTTPKLKTDSHAPKRNKTARNSVKHLKDGIDTAVKLLGVAEDDLEDFDIYLHVCLEALPTKAGERPRKDSREAIALVLNDAYEKLLSAKRNVREALQALCTTGGQ